MWVFLQSHHVVFILGETETLKRWRSQRFGLMFTCEWPADSNPCPGCYYWLPWRCNIRLKQVQGLAEQIVLKQPYGPVMHFTACNYQKQTCFAPLCTTALYISVTPSISSPRVLFDHFWLKNFTLAFFFLNCNFMKMVQNLVTFVALKDQMVIQNCVLHGQNDCHRK